jgi:hypothetical protein
MTPHPQTSLPMLALALLVSAAPALAAPPDTPPPPDAAETAKAFAADAAALAREGRYDEAAAVYEKAYGLDPAPVLLFNLAYVHEKRGDNQAALDTYARYLAVEEDPTHRADAKKRINIVEARMAAVPLKDPVAPEPVPDRPPKRKDRTVMWALIGTGTAVAIAGGVVAAVLLTRDKGGPPTADGVWALPGGGGR